MNKGITLRPSTRCHSTRTSSHSSQLQWIVQPSCSTPRPSRYSSPMTLVVPSMLLLYLIFNGYTLLFLVVNMLLLCFWWAKISPIKEHVIIGGGQAAESVTTGRMDSSQFKVRFFHKMYPIHKNSNKKAISRQKKWNYDKKIRFVEELGSIPGHFGPVETLAFSPDGRSFVSGGWDGYVRLHHFDPSYLFFLFFFSFFLLFLSFLLSLISSIYLSISISSPLLVL